MSIVGRTYYEHGRPVVILIPWRAARAADWTPEAPAEQEKARKYRGGRPNRPRSGPQNVLIRREDGSRVVRPFRGLLRAPKRQGSAA